MIVVLASVVAALAILLVGVKVGRRPVVELLERRAKRSIDEVVVSHLDGRLSLDSAATQLVPLMERWSYYRYLLEPPLPPGTGGSLRAITLAPPGFRDDDPRIEQLLDRVMYHRLGPQRYEEIQALMRERGGPTSSDRPGH